MSTQGGANDAFQVPYHDIPKLCCVSRAFRERAAAELYRVFEHTFGPSQSRSQGLQKDVLAGSLETLATSEYNYASHIKEILFDTANAGDSGERSCREFSYEHSCGKFLQTLLLAVLKRTQGIERFYWNTRIELSSAVYRALHSMPQLRHLHVRLQIGPSLHSTSNTTTAAATASAPAPTIVPAPHHGHYPPPPGYGPPGQSSNYSHHPHQVVVSNVHLVKKAPVARQILRPITFSKFENLASLAVLDMDTLESVQEIAECINKSSGSLKVLCLSLSDKFAKKARKAVTSGSVSENTVTEDDISEVNVAPPPPLNVDGTENTAGSQLPDTPRSYLQAQDNALAQILSSSQPSPPSRELKAATKEVIANAEQEEADRELGLRLRTALGEENGNFFEQMLESLFQRRPTINSDEELPNNQWYGELEGLASKYLESRKSAWKHTKVKKPVKTESRRKKTKLAPPPQLQPSPGPVPPSMFSPSSNNPHYVVQPAVQSFVPVPHATVHPPEASSTTSSQSSASSGWVAPPSSGWGAAAPASDYSFIPNAATAKTINFGPISAPGSLATHQKQNLNHTKSNPSKVWIYPKDGATITGNKPPSVGSNSDGAATPPAPTSGSSTASVNEAQAETKQQNQEVFDDDVDLEHPDEIEDDLEDEDQTFCSSRPADGQMIVEQQHADNTPTASTSMTLDQDQPTNEMQSMHETSQSNQHQMLSVKAKGKQVVRSPPNGHLTSGSEKPESVASYLRLSHGLPLDTLAIYLLPVRASVLLRHIDMHSLKNLCLLNVGPQRGLWATLSKLHRQSPLQLCSIYTDDVTQSLLNFLSNLPVGQLEELALLENGPRAKVPQLENAGKSQVDADDISNMVLKKHMKGLKRLVMRNDNDDRWTIDPATVRLLARDGQKLKELGVQCYSNVFHTLARTLPSFKRLYALQVIFIVDVPQPSIAMNSNHAQPTGANYPASLTPLITNTILEELRHSIIDSMSHCGTVDFELEYIGLAAVNANAPSNIGLGPPAVVLSRVGRVWETWSDEDEDAEVKSDGEGGRMDINGEGGSASRCEDVGEAAKQEAKKEERQLVVWTEDSLRMADLPSNIKMWSKELWAGRL
jgi:hypothetical protein